LQALVFDGTNLEFKNVPKPKPGIGEALIRVLYSGICNTDIEIIKGYMNFSGILGHEFVGVVEECETEEWIGKRVVGEINCGCNGCEYCFKGLQRHCPNRTVLGIVGRDGAHAQYLTLPLSNLHILPENVEGENAVFVEPLAAALEIVEQVHIQPGQKIAVIGDGKLGQLISQVLNLYSVDLVTIGKNKTKLDLLQQRGIQTVEFENADLPQQDIVVECSGVFTGLNLANNLIKPRGTLVLKSTYQGSFQFNPAIWVINEITLVGSRCGPFAPAVQLLAKKSIDPSYLISEVVPAKNAVEAFASAQQNDVLKVIINWQ
jgi:threonine dehydrogenase-like Zn-dependent dehydrogenase